MTKNDRSLIVCAWIIAIGGLGYIASSILSHQSDDPLCACMLCTNNRMPEDGEYLYNHYLFVLSLIWIAIMIILGYVIKERAERNIQKNNKKRNR